MQRNTFRATTTCIEVQTLKCMLLFVFKILYCSNIHYCRNVPSDFAENDLNFEQPEFDGHENSVDDNDDDDNDDDDDDDDDDDVHDNSPSYGTVEEAVQQHVVSVSAEEMENHLSKLEKVRTQVLVLVSQKKKSGVFTCKSSTRTGKKYLVRIKSIPSCTCLEYEKVHLFLMNLLIINHCNMHYVYHSINT